MLCLGAAEGCRRGISCAAPLVDFFDSRDEDMHIRGGSWEMAERDQQTRCKRSGSYPETTVELQHLLGRPLSEVCFQQKEKTVISDASGVKRNMKDCIAFKLHLSEVPENRQVETGDGNIFRLVWLKNKQPAPEGEVPNALDRPAKMDDFPDDEKEGGDDNDDDDGEGDDHQMDEAAQREQDELRRAVEAEGEPGQDDSEIEVLADSDDDLEDFGFSRAVKKVKGFHLRPAWVQLESEDLTLIPRHVKGCSIAYHVGNQQWHGHYPNVHIPMCFSWGRSTKRSETEAILRTVRAVLEAHLLACPKDRMWKSQLAKVWSAEASRV